MTFEGPELARTAANHAALSPVSILKRVERVHPELPAQIHGRIRRSWGEVAMRCKRLASALAARGISKGDTVALLAPNIPEAFECALAIPMLDAVLNANNTRLDADTIAYILAHGDANVLLVDTEFSAIAAEAVAQAGLDLLIVDIEDSEGPGGERIGAFTYDDLLAEGDPDFAYTLPEDEWDALALNYTSGTTGRPKGVVYSHRGAWTNAVNNVVTWEMPHHPVHVWTLPLFRCDGWCFPWTITLLAGCHVFLRAPRADAIYDAFADHGVTHLCGAPIIMSMIVAAEQKRDFPQKIKMMTAAAPPPASVINKMEAMGISITHVYGLTEVYGPAVVCAEKPDWAALPLQERANLKARQGVAYELEEDVLVLDPDTGTPVRWDGTTLGEIAFRSNIVMKGYLKAPEETAKAFKNGWFWSGDIAVQHAEGYIEIRDRSKDIIISGGENISSIEVEKALYLHSAVSLVAVVAMPDEKWGEVPCAFVELSGDATEGDLLDYARAVLAGFKRPKKEILGELPKTSTGKIRKNELRERVRDHR
ncbi:fatty-acyl-CoA synthase [Cribrihabitans marinus]|uniref:Fatty-acyl-CoA synthase n=1 Tax=Cribrihabitans marinus TaxID=1227549 RepID=A0A1H6U9Y7_9RHOB|nr:AMP-binding protein [Cribrihabitans marinus]GGH21201.1 acyl-CoA synthetase [Cribrihabitans marinus]SEI84662.1 fatty-acyl-CoA synthase [Cribrihabitans marinus]